MARKRRSVKARAPKNERIIPVLPSDIDRVLAKWERMDLHSSTFIETWIWAKEAAHLLAEFTRKELKDEESLDDFVHQ